jgi:NAD(P)-dependent dehydrogenase (short-subunit alcohol dehydrogenase family)
LQPGAGLHDALAAANGARIVSLSSSANMIAPVIFDDLHFEFLPYDPFVAYGQSKTACVLLAVEATRRWARDGITADALNPRAIATHLQKHTGGLKTPIERRKTPAQGARRPPFCWQRHRSWPGSVAGISKTVTRRPSRRGVRRTLAAESHRMRWIPPTPSACGMWR